MESRELVSDHSVYCEHHWWRLFLLGSLIACLGKPNDVFVFGLIACDVEFRKSKTSILTIVSAIVGASKA